MIFNRFLCASFFLFLIIGVPVLHAQAYLDPSVMGLFPKDVSGFGFADLSEARKFSWFSQFESQIVPVSLYGFEQLLQQAQMQQEPSIDEIAWARVNPSPAKSTDSPPSGQLVAVARGHFDRDAIQAFLSRQNRPGIPVESNVLYAAGTGTVNDVFFTVVDEQTIIFGGFDSLKRVLGIRAGEEESLLDNLTMTSLISEANGEGIFWGVLDAAAAKSTIARLIPETAKFRQVQDLMDGIKELLVTVSVPSELEIDFNAPCRSQSDAVMLSQLLQAGLLYEEFQSGRTNPDLAQILRGVRIAPNGLNLELSLDATEDELLSLIEHNTFSSLM